jgi:hypothetical protein
MRFLARSAGDLKSAFDVTVKPPSQCGSPLTSDDDEAAGGAAGAPDEGEAPAEDVEPAGEGAPAGVADALAGGFEASAAGVEAPDEELEFSPGRLQHDIGHGLLQMVFHDVKIRLRSGQQPFFTDLRPRKRFRNPGIQRIPQNAGTEGKHQSQKNRNA